MKNFEKREKVLLVILLIVTGALTLWAALANGSIFIILPACGYVLFCVLLFLFSKPPSSVIEHFSWEEIRNAVLVTLAITLLSAAVLLISAEARHIDNTLDGVNLLRINLIAGVAFGVMFWVMLSRVFDKLNIVMLKSFLIAFALATATGASQLNRVMGDVENASIRTAVLRKEKATSGITSYLTASDPPSYIFIPYGDDGERLVVPKGVWNALFQNADIKLSVTSGYLGYQYVAAINDRSLM